MYHKCIEIAKKKSKEAILIFLIKNQTFNFFILIVLIPIFKIGKLYLLT